MMPPRPSVRSEIEECREIAAAIQPLCRRGRGGGLITCWAQVFHVVLSQGEHGVADGVVGDKEESG